MPLCDFEKDVIRLAAGLPQNSIKGWGAGLAVTLEPLLIGGYIERELKDGTMVYSATQRGLEAIEATQ